MKLREDSLKIIIHIADAGAHTLRLTEGDYEFDLKNVKFGLLIILKNVLKKILI